MTTQTLAPVSADPVADLLAENIDAIYARWISELEDSAGIRRDLLGDMEIAQTARRICDEIVGAVARGNTENIRAAEYDALCGLLTSVSARFAALGLSPSETATFVFSAKAALIRFLTAEAKIGPELAVDTIVRVEKLFDALGLVTFEAYASTREGLIAAQTRELEALTVTLEARIAARTTELEASNRELEAFCYTVSHDLQAPLRSLVGYSQALIEDHGADLPPDAHVYLDRLTGESRRMGALIDDLLSLSRVTRQEIRRSRVDLSGLARETMDRIAAREPERRARVRVQPGLAVDGDLPLLRALLENLLANAWKFTSKRADAEIELKSRTEAGETIYSVSDNGVGFDMQYAGKLFKPFQRLHRASEFDGNGIGLATADRIVRRHGGRIWAEAALDRGAAIHFTLAPSGAGQRIANAIA